MNKVILMGRLARDPEVRYSNQGENEMAIARYTLAVDRRGRKNSEGNEQTADFIGCVAFGNSARFAEKYLKKGTRIVVSGRIQTGSYTNKDGAKVYTTDVVIEEQEFAESKSASQGGTAPANNQQGGQGGFGNPNYRFGSASAQPSQQEYYNDGFMNIPDGVDDENLPFN